MLRVSSASTKLLPTSQRCAYWESYSSERLVDLRCIPYGKQGLVAHQANVWTPDLGLSLIQGNSHVIERTQAHIQRTPKERVFVSFDFMSEAFFYQGKTCHSVSPNDLLIYRTDRPYLFGFKHTMRQIILELPESDLTQLRLPQLNEPLKIHAQQGGQRVLMRALATLSRRFVAQPEPSQFASTRMLINEMLIDLIHTHHQQSASSALSTLYVLTASQFIAEQLGHLTLTNAQVAAAVGLTERHLQRVFQQHKQCSVQEYIKEQRLQRAAWLLQQPRNTTKTLSQMAFEAGFNSQAHFSRQFKQRFGQSPSCMRLAPLLQ